MNDESTTQIQPVNKEVKSKNWLWIIVSISAVVGIGAIIFIVIIVRSKNDDSPKKEINEEQILQNASELISYTFEQSSEQISNQTFEQYSDSEQTSVQTTEQLSEQNTDQISATTQEVIADYDQACLFLQLLDYSMYLLWQML